MKFCGKTFISLQEKCSTYSYSNNLITKGVSYATKLNAWYRTCCHVVNSISDIVCFTIGILLHIQDGVVFTFSPCYNAIKGRSGYSSMWWWLTIIIHAHMQYHNCNTYIVIATTCNAAIMYNKVKVVYHLASCSIQWLPHNIYIDGDWHLKLFFAIVCICGGLCKSSNTIIIFMKLMDQHKGNQVVLVALY